MAFNGWMRLWVVVSVLIGIIAGTIAVSTQPSVDSVNQNWCSTGLAVLITAREKAEGKPLSLSFGRNLEEWFREEGVERCTEMLRRFETESIYSEVSDALAPINAEHLQQHARFPVIVRNHWLSAVAGWLAACVLLLLVGWSIAWVRRGFSNTTV